MGVVLRSSADKPTMTLSTVNRVEPCGDSGAGLREYFNARVGTLDGDVLIRFVPND